ncbi:hypothetical protein A0H81_05125 [Grifola frondosa]|uniref:Uncharacterized protein n=1 Tax=Grifola frondosa TaxID=5627 RepID=A0A1C7MD80_GRIFR|nr:hypothetical protein A0H81_05125 [Grifola frondosa]
MSKNLSRDGSKSHRHLFGKRDVDGPKHFWRPSDREKACPAGHCCRRRDVDLGADDSDDSEDSDFVGDDSDDSSGSDDSSDESEGGRSGEGDGQGGGSDEGNASDAMTEDEIDDEDEEDLKPEHHPLLRPGAMPRMSRAAMDAVVGMVEQDLMNDMIIERSFSGSSDNLWKRNTQASIPSCIII